MALTIRRPPRRPAASSTFALHAPSTTLHQLAVVSTCGNRFYGPLVIKASLLLSPLHLALMPQVTLCTPPTETNSLPYTPTLAGSTDTRTDTLAQCTISERTDAKGEWSTTTSSPTSESESPQCSESRSRRGSRWKTATKNIRERKHRPTDVPFEDLADYFVFKSNQHRRP